MVSFIISLDANYELTDNFFELLYTQNLGRTQSIAI